MDEQETVSIILIGESTVGKSSIIRRYTKGTFDSEFFTTLGTDLLNKSININGRIISAQIWDTAGQERFMTITKNFYQRADGIILAYDITQKKSFDKLKKWIENINNNASKDAIICLVANKIDKTDDIKIKTEEGKAKAAEFNMNYYETSAKTGEGIDQLFEETIKNIVERKFYRTKNLSLVNDKKLEKKKCCG